MIHAYFLAFGLWLGGSLVVMADMAYPTQAQAFHPAIGAAL